MISSLNEPVRENRPTWRLTLTSSCLDSAACICLICHYESYKKIGLVLSPLQRWIPRNSTSTSASLDLCSYAARPVGSTNPLIAAGLVRTLTPLRLSNLTRPHIQVVISISDNLYILAVSSYCLHKYPDLIRTYESRSMSSSIFAL